MSLEKFKFVDSFLTKVLFNLRASVENTSDEIEINPELRLNYEVKKELLKVFLEVTVRNKTAPFNFSIEHQGIFDFKEDISNEDVDKVARINCAALLYPFVRESIADLTRKAGFPALLLPPINFIELYKDSDKKASTVFESTNEELE